MQDEAHLAKALFEVHSQDLFAASLEVCGDRFGFVEIVSAGLTVHPERVLPSGDLHLSEVTAGNVMEKSQPLLGGAM